MAVPTFQEFLLPLLTLAGHSEELRTGETAQRLADQLGLSELDRGELLGSGSQTRLVNRVSWAFVYLQRAGLLERVARGRYRITERGREVLAEPPKRFDLEFLQQFPGVVEFRSLRHKDAESTSELNDETAEITETPSERIESGYRRLREALAIELLDRVKRCSPVFFERLVVDLLVAMGYGGSRADAGRAVGRGGDGGIDGIINEDRLGLDVVLIQAKRWEGTVGASTVRDFAGSLEGQRARKGVLITTSRFTADATEYVKRIEKRIVLIDGSQLAELMMDHGVGVSEVSRYTLHRVDDDYFEEEP